MQFSHHPTAAVAEVPAFSSVVLVLQALSTLRIAGQSQILAGHVCVHTYEVIPFFEIIVRMRLDFPCVYMRILYHPASTVSEVPFCFPAIDNAEDCMQSTFQNVHAQSGHPLSRATGPLSPDRCGRCAAFVAEVSNYIAKLAGHGQRSMQVPQDHPGVSLVVFLVTGAPSPYSFGSHYYMQVHSSYQFFSLMRFLCTYMYMLPFLVTCISVAFGRVCSCKLCSAPFYIVTTQCLSACPLSVLLCIAPKAVLRDGVLPLAIVGIEFLREEFAYIGFLEV